MSDSVSLKLRVQTEELKFILDTFSSEVDRDSRVTFLFAQNQQDMGASDEIGHDLDVTIGKRTPFLLELIFDVDDCVNAFKDRTSRSVIFFAFGAQAMRGQGGFWLDRDEYKAIANGVSKDITLGRGPQFAPSFDGHLSGTDENGRSVQTCEPTLRTTPDDGLVKTFTPQWQETKNTQEAAYLYKIVPNNDPLVRDWDASGPATEPETDKENVSEEGSGINLELLDGLHDLSISDDGEWSFTVETRKENVGLIEHLLHRIEPDFQIVPIARDSHSRGRFRPRWLTRLKINSAGVVGDGHLVCNFKIPAGESSNQVWAHLTKTTPIEFEKFVYRVTGDEAEAKQLLSGMKIKKRNVLANVYEEDTDWDTSFDTASFGPNGKEITRKFFLNIPEGANLNGGLSISISAAFNVNYEDRVALDMGAGTHLMGHYKAGTFTPINIHTEPRREYALNDEADAQLYLIDDTTQNVCYASTQGFPQAFIEANWPKLKTRYSDLTVLSGKSNARNHPGLRKNILRATTRFKGHLYRGEETFKVTATRQVNTIDTFKEICRMRFLEAMMELSHKPSSGAGTGLIWDDDAPPPQFIVTHPAYVDPETVGNMFEALRIVHTGFFKGKSATPPTYINSVCTLPEPICILKYLDEKVSVDRSGFVTPVKELKSVGVMDCGSRTVDVATLRQNYSERHWLFASGADLGGTLLDIAIGESVGQVVKNVLGQHTIERFNSHFAFRAGETEVDRVSARYEDRVTVGLQKIEEGKLAFCNGTGEEFKVILSGQPGVESHDNWFAKQFVDAFEETAARTADQYFRRNSDGNYEFYSLWSQLEEQPSVQNYKEDFQTFWKSVLNHGDANKWLMTGRAVYFPPLRWWIEEVALDYPNVELIWPDQFRWANGDDNTIRKYCPKKGVVEGACLLAENLGSFNRETEGHGAVFFTNKSEILSCVAFDWYVQDKEIDVPKEATHVFMARCNKEIGNYIIQKVGNKSGGLSWRGKDVLNRFFIKGAYEDRKPLNMSGAYLTCLLSSGFTQNAPTMAWISFNLEFRTTGSAEIEQKEQFKLARFGAHDVEKADAGAAQ